MSDCLLFQCLVAELWFAPSSQSSPAFNRRGQREGERTKQNKNKQPARDNKRAAAAVLLRLILIGRRRRGGGTEQWPGKTLTVLGVQQRSRVLGDGLKSASLLFYDVYETNFCKFSTFNFGAA